MGKYKKYLVYNISAVVRIDPESPDIESYLDHLREIGAAKIDDVQFVNEKVAQEIIDKF